MKRIINLMTIVLLAALIFANCGKDKPLPDGYQKIVGNQEGEVGTTVLYAAPETGAREAKRVSTAMSHELLLGSFEQYTTGVYLRFNNLPDTVNVLSAELKLGMQDRLAPGDSSYWQTQRKMLVNIFLVDTAGVDPENPPAGDFSNLLSSAEINSDSLKGISFPLDTMQINQWLKTDSSGTQHGFWLEPKNAEYMAVLYSIESLEVSSMPRMTLIYSFTDSTGTTQDTATYYATSDQFIFLTSPEELTLDDNFLYVGRGIAFRTLLDFDFSQFDTTYHINRALLQLTSNAANSIRNEEGGVNTQIYRLTAPWNEADLWENPNSASYSPDIADSLFEFDITPTVQGWITKEYENYGFQLQSFSEGITLGRIAFYSVNADSSLQPKIKLYYTLPANHDF